MKKNSPVLPAKEFADRRAQLMSMVDDYDQAA